MNFTKTYVSRYCGVSRHLSVAEIKLYEYYNKNT